LAFCPRSELDTDTVLYLTSEEERLKYAVRIDAAGLLRPLLRPDETITTGAEGWIFVSKGDILYAYFKKTSSRPRIHHSTFLAGEAVEAAGLFVAEDGRLLKVFPHSGHYRPTEWHLRCLLQFFLDRCVDLRDVEVDAQRVLKVARQTHKDGVKKKKVEGAAMHNGLALLDFLTVKQRMLDNKTLKQIVAAAAVMRYRRMKKMARRRRHAERAAHQMHVLGVTPPDASPQGTHRSDSDAGPGAGADAELLQMRAERRAMRVGQGQGPAPSAGSFGGSFSGSLDGDCDDHGSPCPNCNPGAYGARSGLGWGSMGSFNSLCSSCSAGSTHGSSEERAALEAAHAHADIDASRLLSSRRGLEGTWLPAPVAGDASAVSSPPLSSRVPFSSLSPEPHGLPRSASENSLLSDYEAGLNSRIPPLPPLPPAVSRPTHSLRAMDDSLRGPAPPSLATSGPSGSYHHFALPDDKFLDALGALNYDDSDLKAAMSVSILLGSPAAKDPPPPPHNHAAPAGDAAAAASGQPHAVAGLGRGGRDSVICRTVMSPLMRGESDVLTAGGSYDLDDLPSEPYLEPDSTLFLYGQDVAAVAEEVDRYEKVKELLQHEQDHARALTLAHAVESAGSHEAASAAAASVGEAAAHGHGDNGRDGDSGDADAEERLAKQLAAQLSSFLQHAPAEDPEPEELKKIKLLLANESPPPEKDDGTSPVKKEKKHKEKQHE
jgi:hypothetical protein